MATIRKQIPFPPPQPRVEVVEITPEMAAQWMGREQSQRRPISDATVDKYAREMKEGRWKINGEAVKIGRGGGVLDGNHRLTACIRSGVPFTSVVIFDVDDNVFDTLDQGRKRSGGDILSIQGEAHYNTLAAAAATLWKYERGLLIKTGKGTYPSGQEIRAAVEHHPGLRESVSPGRRAIPLLPGGVGTFLHYVFSLKDADLASWFMEALGSGADLDKGNPVLVLRERLQANRAAKAKLPRKELFALAIKAWNHCRAGRKSIRFLRWRAEGDMPEAFPEIQ